MVILECTRCSPRQTKPAAKRPFCGLVVDPKSTKSTCIFHALSNKQHLHKELTHSPLFFQRLDDSKSCLGFNFFHFPSFLFVPWLWAKFCWRFYLPISKIPEASRKNSTYMQDAVQRGREQSKACLIKV